MGKYLRIFVSCIALVLVVSSVVDAKPRKLHSTPYDFDDREEDVRNSLYGSVFGRCLRSEIWCEDDTGEEYEILVFATSDQPPWPGEGYVEIRGGIKTWHSGKTPRSSIASFQTNSDNGGDGIILKPNSDYLKVFLTTSDLNIRAVIYNINGQEVQRMNSQGNSEIELHIYHLQSGAYFVILENSEMSVSKKLIITN